MITFVSEAVLLHSANTLLQAVQQSDKILVDSKGKETAKTDDCYSTS